MSIKPNPAVLACDCFDINLAKKDLSSALEQSKDNVREIVLKDITTYRGDISRLEKWSEMAMQLIDGA
jgi:hypothetical protein